MPEISPIRRQFKPIPFGAMQWTGTNHAELNEVFGPAWDRRIVGHPLDVGNWLYQLDGAPEIYVMTDRVMVAFTEPAKTPVDAVEVVNAVNQLRAYAAWCLAHDVAADDRTIVKILDGEDEYDYSQRGGLSDA